MSQFSYLAQKYTMSIKDKILIARPIIIVFGIMSVSVKLLLFFIFCLCFQAIKSSTIQVPNATHHGIFHP